MLQVLGNLEDGDVMLIDHDLFTGSGIARHPALALLHFEASESADLDVPSGLQSIDDCGNEAIHDGLRFHFCQPCGRRDDIHDICFSQATSQKSRNEKSENEKNGKVKMKKGLIGNLKGKNPIR